MRKRKCCFSSLLQITVIGVNGDSGVNVTEAATLRDNVEHDIVNSKRV